MPSSKLNYEQPLDPSFSVVKEGDIEDDFIKKLVSLKYTHRPDIHDRAALEANFREKFERLNAVSLITAQTEQIAALKEHKKGLMQQLFPS